MNLPLTTAETRAPTAGLALCRAAWAAAAVGLALRLAFALLPLRVHLIVLEDDAWMVTAIARNFALGRGISADGLTLTTGFQPLYPLTLGALPYLVAPDALDAGFTANLVICALLNALALWPLWSLARRFGGETAGLLAVALFALNPLLVRNSVNAMETSLGLLLLLTLFAAFYRLDLTRPRGVLALAGLTALAVLARLDAALAFGAITLALAFRRPTTDDGPMTDDRRPTTDDRRPTTSQPSPVARGPWSVVRGPWPVVRARLAALYVAATLALLAPYFAFNQIVGGSLGPSSGAALAFMHSYRESFSLTSGLGYLFLTSAVALGWLRATWAQLVLVLAFGALLAWAIGRRLGAALPLLLYAPIPPLYYGYILQQDRERYFVGLSALLIILLAWLGAELLRRAPGRASAAAVGLAAALIVALNTGAALRSYAEEHAAPWLTQPTAYQAALWMREHLPPGAVVGAKNSGLYQYYSGHTVLNIDGKLNHEILPAMQRRALLDYLRARGVQYLVDREQTMADHIAFYSHQFGPAPLHRAPSLIERAGIYGKMALNALGVGSAPSIDQRAPWQPARPFSAAADVVQRFPRPNQASNPVVLYRLKPAGAPGVP